MNRDPVKDININSGTKLGDLVEQFGQAGGFVASKVSTASSIVKDMNSDIDLQRLPTKFTISGTQTLTTGKHLRDSKVFR